MSALGVEVLSAIKSYKEILSHLRNRRSMYVDEKYTSLIYFIQGYNHGIQDTTNYNLLLEFQEWLRTKVDHHFSIHWGWYILNHMAAHDEKVATDKLFSLFDEFLNYRTSMLS